MDVASSGTPVSSDIHKKIKRKHFKDDIALKAFKCDFIASDINTQAKVYISSTAVNVVHRPKRRKLTTVPFATVVDIESRRDSESLDFRINNGAVYTLTKFERPDYAIAFILNYWNMVRKEKLLLKCSGLPAGAKSLTLGSLERLNITPADLDLLKTPTTISLNSSTSMSETESVDYQKRSAAANSTAGINIPLSSDRLSSSRSTETSISDLPIQPNPTNPSRGKLRSIALRSPQFDPPPRTTPSSQSRDPQTDVKQPLAPSLGSPTHHPSPTTTKQKPIVCLTESPGWTFWLSGLLPYPFCPPQRFTMALAYVILAFLLFSTIHLYHRLAIFDVLGSHVLNLDLSTSVPVHRPGSMAWQGAVRSLESDLSRLVQLAEQLSQALLSLTVEVHTWSTTQVQSTESQTAATSTTKWPSS